MDHAKKVVPVVAVDGPSGAGKGTVCKLLAQKLGWHLLDSGALYRVLALAARRHQVALDNEASLYTLAANLDVQFPVRPGSELVLVVLEGEPVDAELRTEETGRDASKVAALPRVREALLSRQRAFREMPGLVADGRDMGTVVFADAPLKFFLDASAEERAKRRHKQLIDKGVNANIAALLQGIRERDERDRNRSIAPLVPADDAKIIDTTTLDIAEVMARILPDVQLMWPET